jgi:hypothetical protein
LPGCELPIAGLDQPVVRNRADDGFGSVADDAAAVGAGDRELGHEVGLGDPGFHVGCLAGAKGEGGLHRRSGRGCCGGCARDDSVIDAAWSMLGELMPQRCELLVVERLGGDDQEVDVAACGHEVIERERAVQDHRDQRLSERVRTPRREPRRQGEGAETLDVGHEARWRSSASNGANSGQPI